MPCTILVFLQSIMIYHVSEELSIEWHGPSEHLNFRSSYLNNCQHVSITKTEFDEILKRILNKISHCSEKNDVVIFVHQKPFFISFTNQMHLACNYQCLNVFLTPF